MSSKRSNSSSSGSSFFSLGCGCKDSKSVSVSDSISDTSERSPPLPPPPTSQPSFQEQEYVAKAETEDEDEDEDQDNNVAPSFSGLLRQLGDLEETVLSLAPQPQLEEEEDDDDDENRSEDNRSIYQQQRQQHRQHCQRRTRSMGGGLRVLEDESVAVVKETDDPLGDFRRSMLQMIVEKEIVTGEELRQLLNTFLALNSPRHHDVILRAFADIWNEVFSGVDPTPDSLRRSRSSYYHRRSR